MTDLRDDFELACPSCDQADELFIAIKTLARVTADGSEPDGDHEWDDHSYCRCRFCGHDGIVADFRIKPEPSPPTDTDDGPSPTFHDAAAIADQPTAFPWIIQHDVAARPSIIAPRADGDGILVAHVFAFDRDTSIHNIAQATTNARFIMQACSAHQSLVSALAAILEELATDYTDSDERLISIKAIATIELTKLRAQPS